MTSPIEVVLAQLRGDERQWEAYEASGHCVVLAGPGSGKTKVLTAKIARLLAEEASEPRGVACVTFNNECASALQTRLSELGVRKEANLFVGTVHAFCLACVDAPFLHLYEADLQPPLKVATQTTRLSHLAQVMEGLGIRGNPQKWLEDIDLYRRQYPLGNPESADDTPTARLVSAYEGSLKSKGFLDFAGLIGSALKMIRSQPLVRKALEARFPYFVVDEYQDLGCPLHLIVQSLLELTNVQIFVVGDPDQSIYSFSGADPSYLRELAALPEVRTVELEMNYRSGQRIINGSQIALGLDEPRSYRSARNDQEGSLAFRLCPDGLDEQAETVCGDIIPSLNAGGIPNGEIAVLYIDHFDAEVLASALQNAGISFAGERDRRYKRTPFTRWLEGVAAWSCFYPHTGSAPRFDELLGLLDEIRLEAGIPAGPSELEDRTTVFEVLHGLPGPHAPLGEWLVALDSGLSLRSNMHGCSVYEEDLETFTDIQRQCSDGGDTCPLLGRGLRGGARGGQTP